MYKLINKSFYFDNRHKSWRFIAKFSSALKIKRIVIKTDKLLEPHYTYKPESCLKLRRSIAWMTELLTFFHWCFISFVIRSILHT